MVAGPIINQLAAPSVATPSSLPSSAWAHTKTPWHSTLVLIRHGQSEWNAANRFTGWTDIDLTDEGRREAAAGAEALRDIGISRFDRAFTSELVRAQETLDIVLSSIGQPPWRGAGAASALVRRHWRLNERHYGALQGRSKLEMIDEHGREQVRLWRQSFDAPPPPVGADDARHPGNDAAYARVPRHLLPRGECLRDTQRRVMPYWQRCIAPELRLRGRAVLVAAHGHSLRAIVKSLDRVADDDIQQVKIPNGVPLLYRLDAAGRPLRLEEDGLISGVWLGDDEARRRVANAGQILDRQVA